ncbi:MAG: hypothetical protein HY650_11340 [Acidobacteria bacterium]|nr:hypothetical protein [Acidobacteriota bacterium]
MKNPPFRQWAVFAVVAVLSLPPLVVHAGGMGVTPPRLFFTDLESGPNTGGQDDLGAFITIYGEGFGVQRGSSTVTIAGQEVARYVIWGEDHAARSLDLIVVQPGSRVTSGDILVTVNGVASNPLPLAIRPGNIYFVSTSGDDSNAGSFAQPWRTIVKAKDTISPGDIAYVMDGVSQTAEDNFSAALSIETSGMNGAPKALVAYPGATATIGSTDPNIEFGIRIPNLEGLAANDWVIAKLVLRSRNQALEIGGSGSSRWRIVGNDISCPVGDGELIACFVAALASHVAFLGNQVHDIGRQNELQPFKTYHAVYFGTDTNHVEVGWNHIRDNDVCRALQFHSSPLLGGGANDPTGYNQYDLIVHDNLIHGAVCDGINFATVDPSKGPVRAYNNIIFGVGRGPTPRDEDANYAGIYVSGGVPSEGRPEGTGVVETFNNTLYDCGRAQGVSSDNTDKGALSRGPGSSSLFMSLRNNIVYGLGGEDYIARNSATSLITGSNNLWFGGGAAPAFLTGNVSADPLFVNMASGEFRLRAESPAIDAGINTGLNRDYLGIFRPQGPDYDIGAHEFMNAPGGDLNPFSTR